MVSYTGRLKLAKQAEQGEVVDVALLNQNFDDIDKLSGGPFVCTKVTRPAAPYVGMQIFETDTMRRFMWDGTYWQYMGGGAAPLCRMSASNVQTYIASAGTAYTQIYDMAKDTANWDETYFEYIDKNSLTDGDKIKIRRPCRVQLQASLRTDGGNRYSFVQIAGSAGSAIPLIAGVGLRNESNWAQFNMLTVPFLANTGDEFYVSASFQNTNGAVNVLFREFGAVVVP